MHWIRIRGAGEWTFRAPSYFEQFGHGRLDIRQDLVEPSLLYAHLDTLISAANLDPERSQTYSGALDLLIPWSLRLTFGLYRKQLTDPIVFRSIEEGYSQATNGDQTTWRGGFVAGQWAIWDSLELAGRLSFDDPVDDPNQFVPDKSGWGTITYRRTLLHGDLRLIGRVEGVYWGERILSQSFRTYTVPEASVVNFRITATIREFTIFWGMNNVFSERYRLVGGYPMIHREEIYGVRWNFLD
jgi:outer membrane cobalamin receptor